MSRISGGVLEKTQADYGLVGIGLEVFFCVLVAVFLICGTLW